MSPFFHESVLVIRPGALGDAVLTLPVLQALRSAGARQTIVLGIPGHWRWLRAAGNDVTIADWNGPEWMGLSSLDVPLADSALRTLRSVEGALIFLRSGVREAAQALRGAGVAEILAGSPPAWPEAPGEADDGRHAADRLLDPLRERLGSAWCASFSTGGTAADLDERREPFLAVAEEEREAALRRLGIPAPPSAGFFAVHPGSGGRSKCWPAERYVELLRRAARSLPSKPLLFVGPAEEETLAPLLRDLPDGVLLARSFPLREVLALLTMARVFAGNDAGVTHLAARCCPTLQLFGHTRPSRWKALGPRVTALQAPDGLLERLEVEKVWQAILATCP